MSRTSKKMSVPLEFDIFIDGLSSQISRDLGMPKNKSQTMRLMATSFKDKIVFRDKKFDIKLF